VEPVVTAPVWELALHRRVQGNKPVRRFALKARIVANDFPGVPGQHQDEAVHCEAPLKKWNMLSKPMGPPLWQMAPTGLPLRPSRTMVASVVASHFRRSMADPSCMDQPQSTQFR